MKLAKLSLAAIMAAGAFSFASATPLTDAIKGVDLSGMVRLRFYNDNRDKSSVTPDLNRWRTSADFKFTLPVSDAFKFVYQLSVENNMRTNGNVATTAFTSGTATENQSYISYSSNGLNVIAGRVPVATTVTTSGHGENIGDGAIATYSMGNFTAAGAFIDDINVGVVGGADIAALAGIYNSKMFDAQAWYYRITNVAKYVYTISVNVKPMAGLKIHGDYAAGKLDIAGADNKNYYNLSASYAANAFSVMGGYAATNKKVGVISLNADAPIGNVIPVEQNYNIANATDTAAFYAKVGYNVNKKTNVSFRYANINDKTVANVDSNEYDLEGSYQYNKKLRFSSYYSMLKHNSGNKSLNNNEFRFEAKYSF